MQLLDSNTQLVPTESWRQTIDKMLRLPGE